MTTTPTETARAIRDLRDDVRLLEDQIATLKWTEGIINKLQRALAFWHPGVDGRDDDAFLTRAGDDAELLFGYEGPSEASAVELGWIAVNRNEVTP